LISSIIKTINSNLTGKDGTLHSVIINWLDRAIILWLFLMALAAPHSIAATQTAWLLGMLCWALRFAFRPRPPVHRTPVDYALLGFFILTGLSAFLSYEPLVSIGKLRAASLFTIVYLVAENVRSRSLLRALALTLVASCLLNVVFTLGQRIVGRGVRVENLSTSGPLFVAGIRDGDTLLEVEGHTLHNPEELFNALNAANARVSVQDNSKHSTALTLSSQTTGTNATRPAVSAPPGSVLLKFYRLENYWTVPVARSQLLEGDGAQARLGIGSWRRGRDWRASGFYGHYVTYAEALQLIASLAFGLFIAFRGRRALSRVLMLLALLGFGLAMVLTVTRASWLALLISTCVIVLAGAGKRTALIFAACLLLTVPVGLYVLQQKRNVGFVDQKDESIRWRETVWREGLDLLLSKPRHLLLGVGMDSLKKHWREWGLFDNGRLPLGHMHSNLLQLAVERGLPTLFAWLILLALYARMLWRLARRRAESHLGWIERGVVLGAMGGLAGFFASGLVHYNFGDSEVVMILYLILGLTLVIERKERMKDESAAIQA
jgi:O-antigen ligase